MISSQGTDIGNAIELSRVLLAKKEKLIKL